MFEIESKPQKSHPLDRADAASLHADEDAPAKVHPLDETKMVALHRRLMGHYIRELDVQAENRLQMHLDEEFYDGIQWNASDAAELEARGQKPTVYNVLAPTIDWVTGSEKRARSDFKVLPRRKAEAKPAERKTQILKYLADVNRTAFDVSRAFEDAVKAGIGWIEDGVESDPSGEPVYTRYESWRNVFFDSLATEMDLSDGRYIGRAKWVDLDVALTMFPSRAGILEQSVEQNDSGFSLSDSYGDDAMDSVEMAQTYSQGTARENAGAAPRERIRLIEIWFRVPQKIDVVKGGSFSGEHLDLHSPGHRESIESGEAEKGERSDMVMHVALMTPVGLLWHGKSPYRHNRFPLTPIWGYRRKANGLPYGMIRRLRDIQEDVNKRASKALHILSTNKMIVEEGISDDMDELVDEAQRPDGVMIVKTGGIEKLKMNAERELPQFHLELMSRSIAMIQQASGVTDELLGRRTNASSGIAIQRRQDQGTMATSALFDNLRFSQQVRGEKQLSLAEQFVSERKAFRITNSRGTPEFVEVNDGEPDNDIVRSKADFIISEADWRASMRQAAVDELLEVVGKMAPVAPQLVMVMLDLIIESMDIPNREEIVRRIRQVTGMNDPDSDEPSPEQQQREAANQAQAKLQADMAAAQLAGLVAKARRDDAQARKSEAETIGSNVSAQQGALAAAGTALSMPGAIDIADHILDQSGFVSKAPQGLADHPPDQPPAGATPQGLAAPPAPQQNAQPTGA